MKKAPYDPVTLRVSWATSGPPAVVPGDEFKTSTGRRYLVLRIRGKQHHCLVLPDDAPVEGRQWCLTWNCRRRK